MTTTRSTGACLALLTAILCACGGNEPAPAAPTNAQTESGHHGHHGEHKGSEKGEHHGDLPPPVHAFHETLAPLWHDKSPDRATKTCAQAETLREKATATNDRELTTLTTELAAECKKDGRPEFEAKFKAVHERFHALAEKK